jgi:hypothetical protein
LIPSRLHGCTNPPSSYFSIDESLAEAGMTPVALRATTVSTMTGLFVGQFSADVRPETGTPARTDLPAFSTTAVPARY